MTRRLVLLGSGTSFGVPVIGCDCRVCTSTDIRDQRTRTAALVENDAGTRLLIDTPPELRLRLLRTGVGGVDAVLYTHEHADHVHGIDDLRAMSFKRGRLPVYGPPETVARIAERFPYIFDDGVVPPRGTSKPELTLVALVPNRETSIAGVPVLPIEFGHGGMRVYGYRFGPVAYLTDVKEVPAVALGELQGVEVLVVNALFEQPHPTHLSIPEAVELARTLGTAQTFLTHLTHRFSHADLEARLPPGIAPAYDGLVIEF